MKDEDKAAFLLNDLANHYLVMECMDRTFGYAQVVETAGSHRDVHKAWVDLCKRYEDVMVDDLIALTTVYNDCKTKMASDNPCL